MREHQNLPPEKMFRNTGENWLQLLLQQLDDKTRAKTLLILCRSWHLRNDIVHNDGRETIAGSVSFLRSYLTNGTPQSDVLEDHKGKQSLPTTTCTGTLTERKAPTAWTKPPPGWTKVNSDGSFLQDDGTGGLGIIARECEGAVIFVDSSKLHHCEDAEKVEAKAALQAVTLLGILGHEKIILEVDCAAVATALCATTSDRSKL
ncbi:hypothetical protein QYE76_004291 [Lolium multiflorum]|uniref:RNase H type-1 domain-containing protein n=1 Tax=Lolium multiflorum TaxID=4521 RepID=A0AAD8RQC4_LOLMU|nr:hypothetical protein QYE76_004291 [Lolium multiflorum]